MGVKNKGASKKKENDKKLMVKSTLLQVPNNNDGMQYSCKIRAFVNVFAYTHNKHMIIQLYKILNNIAILQI